MIAPPKPGTPAFRILALLVATPRMTAGELAAEVFPVRMPRCPYAGPANTAGVTRWREEYAAAERAAVARATRLLGRLQEAGYVEPLGPPRLAEWVEPAIRTAAARLQRDWRNLAESLDGPATLTPEEADRRAVLAVIRRRASSREAVAWHARIVAALRVDNPPGSVRALMGPRPGGQANRAYRRLDEMGILVTPSQRVATVVGEAHLAKYARGAA